jgi:hypothetical protein
MGGPTRNPARQRRHGIYPTPPALVGYLVRSVHRLLQARFGWSAGLADPRVRLLDPAAGAMPFLRAAWRLALEACWHQGGEPRELLAPNLAPALLASLAERYGEAPSPEEVLGYVYAMLYDPAYRARYRKLLRGDFPRIPFPRERAPFLRLAGLGAELIGLHRLADPRLLDPPVGLTGDSRQRLGSGLRSFRYRSGEGRLDVNNAGLAFTGISPEVHSYTLGGHPVLLRWLGPRCGRALPPEEVLTFRRIASALSLTLEVQARIADDPASPPYNTRIGNTIVGIPKNCSRRWRA